MSGQPGRSGRRRKPIGEHILAGTYRRDRHGPLPPPEGNVVMMPGIEQAEPAPVPRWLTAGLHAAGKRLVRQMWEENCGRADDGTPVPWSAADQETLRLAGETLDRIRELQGAMNVPGCSTAHRLRLLRHERQAVAQFIALKKALTPRVDA